MPKPIRRLLAHSSLATALSLLAAPAFAQSLSLLDARVVEGNTGNAMLLFEARLSAPAAGPVSFDFATSDETAYAGTDYGTVSLVGKLVIPAGQTSLRVSVPVVGEDMAEGNEILNATISNVAGASVARGAAHGVIFNDDNKMLVSAPYEAAAQEPGSTGYATDFSALSRDGRFVAFVSTAGDLVAGGPANAVKNVYVRDTRTGLTTLVSIAADGGDADGDSTNPSLSADGRFVVFESAASNIAGNDSNNAVDVFRRDLQTGTTTLVSVNSAGSGPASGYSVHGSISADGRYVAFQSTAPDIVASGDINGRPDAFVRDMDTGATRLVSYDLQGLNTNSDWEGGYRPYVSADGRYVVYDRGGSEPWRRDISATSPAVRVANGFGGQPPNGMSYSYGISDDGRYVVMLSWATNLTATGGGNPGVYVSDVDAGTTVFASATSGGGFSWNAFYPSMSGDGRYVLFQTITNAAGEQPDDGRVDIYVRDLQASTTTRVSNNWQGGINSGGNSEKAAISGDGRVVSFLSESPTMLPRDHNSQPDLFRVELPLDAAETRLTLGDAWVTETDAGTQLLNFPVALDGGTTTDVSFEIQTVDGTAAAGSDYQAANLVPVFIPAGMVGTTITIEVNGDAEAELDESLDLYLGNLRGARTDDAHATGIIANDDAAPPATLSIGDVSISEGNGAWKLATFTVSLSNAVATPVSFDLQTANGSATAGSDYDLASYWGATIPAGSTSIPFNIVIRGDSLVEADETFQVNVSNVSGAAVADGQAIGTITNDDAYPAISIGDVALAEDNSGTQLATFTITLSAAAASPVGFDIATSDGTATAGSDYVARALTGQVIPAGAASATFSVTVNGDAVVEADESFSVDLANVSGALVADGHAVGTIGNDDVLPSLSVADVAIAEGNSGTRVATFTVQLSAPAAAPVSYSYATANGTAVAPGDYVARSGSSTIQAGLSSQSLTVTINGDTAIEPSETFLLNISGVNGATVADGQAVGTISNDDVLPSLSVADVSITEGNNSSKLATFTVTLSAAATGPVSFNIATANGTAVAPGDYTAKTATGQVISAGALSKTFTVSVKGDKTREANETFFVNLSNASGATIADAQAIGTIVNDDGAALSVARVSAGGLYDDVDDRRGDPVLAPREYALLLLDTAQKLCARAGGASIVGVDGVESLAVLADLADVANGLCARQPQYGAVLKAQGMGFLVERGAKLIDVATPSADARATAVTVLAAGHERPLTVLLAATPSTNARERDAQAAGLDRVVRERLAADPRARLVVLSATRVAGLADLTARALPAGTEAAERVWASPALLEEFERVMLEIPGGAKPQPAQQVLQLQP